MVGCCRVKDPGSPGFSQQAAAATEQQQCCQQWSRGREKGCWLFSWLPWAAPQQTARGLCWMAPSKARLWDPREQKCWATTGATDSNVRLLLTGQAAERHIGGLSYLMVDCCQTGFFPLVLHGAAHPIFFIEAAKANSNRTLKTDHLKPMHKKKGVAKLSLALHVMIVFVY